MKSLIPRCCGLLIILALSVWPGAAQTQFIVTASPFGISALTAQNGLTAVEPLSAEAGAYLVTVPAGVSLAQNGGLQSVEANTTLETSEADPLSKVTVNTSAIQSALANTATVSYYGGTVRAAYVNQPAAAMIHSNLAHGMATGGPVVAIIDTGVDPTHPALANVLTGGYDFTRNQVGIPDERLDLNPTAAALLAQSSVVPAGNKTQPFILSQSTVVILDQSTVVILDGGGNLPSDFGHGTMVAGLIHLVAPTALIMPLKAFQADGSANLSDVIRAIYYAVDNGAQVINMSFDSETPSPGLQAAIAYATSRGVTLVAAAGNEGEQELVYPAGLANVIGVGSSTAADGRSTFSNYGVPSVFMTAPGEALITAYPGNNYAGVWGTSFSTALVSGAAALLAQISPGSGYAGAADPLGNGHPISESLGLGESRLDVLATLQSLMGDE